MIIILDFGSQYCELIARRIRELNVYSEVLRHDTSLEIIKERYNPSGIIFSGGPNSIFQDKAPICDPAIFESNIPILGICYGMHLIAHHFSGKVTLGSRHEYGPAALTITSEEGVFKGLPSSIDTWMSHGDSVTALPKQFECLASTDNCEIAAFGELTKSIFGVQFHPEVSHTPKGSFLIKNFVLDICRASSDWNAGSFVEKAIEKIRAKVKHEKVLCALSGGVDSAVAAALLQRAIGDRLTCVFIDQGFMRKDEGKNIDAIFKNKFDINLKHINAESRFFKELEGVTDPELKRKRIGEAFIRVFEETSGSLKSDFPYLAQGTLYPDIIESAKPDISNTAVTIKTHHNVGGLPEDMEFKIIEPLKMLFKDEVRQVGLELGLPEEVVYRHPFPGPGLAIRILGEVTPERVALLQEADAIVMEEVKKAGLYRALWQCFAVLLPIKSVGVMGDKRTYQNTVAIRAVTSEDAMTAQWAKIPYEVLDTFSSRIINEVTGINRVVYDITSKPPGTIEWE